MKALLQIPASFYIRSPSLINTLSNVVQSIHLFYSLLKSVEFLKISSSGVKTIGSFGSLMFSTTNTVNSRPSMNSSAYRSYPGKSLYILLQVSKNPYLLVILESLFSPVLPPPLDNLRIIGNYNYSMHQSISYSFNIYTYLAVRIPYNVQSSFI